MTPAAPPVPTPSVEPQQRPNLLSPAFRNVVFLGFHAATVVMAVIAGVPSWQVLAFCAAFYFARMFGITAGYHRYFSHRTYKTSRPFQFALALLGTLSLQKGVLWWSAHHRWHHRFSDTDQDVHSPIRGFFHSHMGWIIGEEATETRFDQVKDLTRYPELRWLNPDWACVGLFATLCAVVFFGWGFQAMTWICFVGTVVLWHGTFTINSLAHVWGKRVYATSDTSRNNVWLALLTMGEGWHNNHHYYPSSTAQGFRWYEIDVTYRILWLLSKVGLVWDIKRPSPEVVAGRLGRRSWLVQDRSLEPAVPREARAAGSWERKRTQPNHPGTLGDLRSELASGSKAPSASSTLPSELAPQA